MQGLGAEDFASRAGGRFRLTVEGRGQARMTQQDDNPDIEQGIADAKLVQQTLAGDDSALVFNIAGTVFSANSGVGVDPGFNQTAVDPIIASDLDAFVEIMASTVGLHTITLSGSWSDGVNVIPLADIQVLVNVIPEPGTALLMGLGLAGLAAAGRRQ